MPNVFFNFEVEESLKKKFERKAETLHRTTAGQLRFLMEQFVEMPEKVDKNGE